MTQPKSNPITEMKARKNQATAQAQAEAQATEAKTEAQAQTTAQETATAKTKLTFSPYPQISRMFEQTRTGVKHCLENFPDCFHHKHQLGKECKQIQSSLNDVLALLNNQANLNINTKKRAVATIRYLSRAFERVKNEVQNVEAEAKEQAKEQAKGQAKGQAKEQGVTNGNESKAS